jgi:hypothetical protein
MTDDLAVLTVKLNAAFATLRDLHADGAPERDTLPALQNVRRLQFLIREAKRRQRKDAA